MSDAPQKPEDDGLDIPAFLDRRKKKATEDLTVGQQSTTSEDSEGQEPRR